MNIFLPWKLGFLAMRLQLHLLVKEAPWVGRGQPTRDVAVELLTSIMPTRTEAVPSLKGLHSILPVIFFWVESKLSATCCVPISLF